MADVHGRSPRLAIRHKVWLDAGRRFALGDGGVVLLRAVDTAGSIRAAAERAGWSFARVRGGVERGGAALTPRGRDFLRRYDRFRRRLDHALRDLYAAAFRERRA
ncbi:MAG: hypothetical protein HYS77_15035 [Candidatus Rokubacteria bacterium]|nr:hypothetical protein [Candidatus Rokubacteria bacterium]